MQKPEERVNKRQLGTYYELLAIQYLISKGYTILIHSYRCRFGEIDIIARDKEYTIFIEVKYRKSGMYGYPREAVNINKQKRIIRTAMCYLKNEVGYESLIRFDIIEFLEDKVTHLESAFY